ncbi:MAG: oligoendopeptidase F [Oscillospiraceae bacterium]|nr:oligoendopeptidase F [Oscillospiraceae bacterium]
MLRNEIAVQDTWDLSRIFKSSGDWEQQFRSVSEKLEIFPNLEQNMLRSAEDLFQTITKIFEIGEQVNRLYTYASLKYCEDTTNQDAKRLLGKAQNLVTAYSGATAFFDTTLLELQPERLETFLKEHKDLQEYEILLRDLYRYQPHTLSKSEEKMLALFQKERETASDVYQTFTDSDLKFGNILDEDGNSVELTDTNYMLYLQSGNREVRKSAFRTLYASYQQYQNTFAALYAGQIETEKTLAQARKFDSALAMSLFADSVTPEIYQNIIENISGHLDVLFQYYQLKKKVLKLNELHIYDIYLPLMTEVSRKYSYEEAVQQVLSAMEIFGEDYVEILRKGYADRWVDVYPNQGKTGGAFSGGCATTDPYILLNFQGLEEDVSTLAHESGHSMHSYFTRTNNPIQYADYRIFVAEVPSTVNELILAYYKLEHSQSREEKLSVLNHLMELYKGTIYRQIMFAEFEKITHELAEQGEILTADLLNQKYYALNQKYFGDEVILDPEIAFEWMRIPHMYYNFYVYKYAIGLTAASHIVKRIRNHEPGALDDYFAFLKTGTTKNPVESLKIAGVDMTGTDVFDSAITMFGEVIREFEKIYSGEAE